MIPLPPYQEMTASSVSSLPPSSFGAAMTAAGEKSSDLNYEPTVLCCYPEARMSTEAFLPGDVKLFHE